MTAVWDERQHPRHPSGTKEGGEFAPSGVFQQLRNELEERKKEWEEAGNTGGDYSRFWDFYRDEQGAVELPPDWILGYTYEPETVDAVDRLIREAPFYSRDEIPVYRGEPVRDKPEPGVRDRPSSTSFSKAKAMNYADRTGRGDEKGLMRVIIPAGTKLGWAGGEDEIVLPSGTDYQLQSDGTFLAVVPPEYRVMQASGWDEKKHPRMPAGSYRGGEFRRLTELPPLNERAEMERVRERMENAGFPPGSFTPDDSVKFWPQKIGAYSGYGPFRPKVEGPFWKALADLKTGEEKAFWFVDEDGYPHHTHMREALGLPGDLIYNQASGYGETPLNTPFAGKRPDGWADPAEAGQEIVRRHRRDIRDAEAMLEGAKEMALAASALNFESEALTKAVARLQRQYEKVYRRAAKRARDAYLAATKVVKADATPDEVVKAVALVESFHKLTGAARRAMLGEVLDALKLIQEATAREEDDQGTHAMELYLDLLQQQAGTQAERLVAGAQDAAASVLLDSVAEGWSVPQTATALKLKLESIAPWQATMLARTDLVALANGASLRRAVTLDDPGSAYKTWLATPDERTRIDHRHAHGQTVPIQQPFTVGGEQLLYPGDPSASDGNVINCRCTVVYGPTPFGPEGVKQIAMLPDLAVSAAGWDESKHPRDPGGERGGQFVHKGAGAADYGRVTTEERERWDKDGITVWHLGPYGAEGSIAKHGLLPGGGGVGAEHPGQDFPTEFHGVYALESKDVALDQLGQANEGIDSDQLREYGLTAYEITVPPGHADKMARDSEYSWAYTERIPPEWIKFYDDSGRWRSLTAAASSEAVLELHRTRARGRAFGHAFVEAEHPRHPAGTPEGGEFAPKGAVVDWAPARAEFEKWAADLAPYYAEDQGYPPGYWGRERLKAWEQYQAAVNTTLPALQARLNGAQVPGLRILPELNPAPGGDMDAVLDPGRRYGPDFQVELPAAREGLTPGFTVWTYPDEATEVEDVLDITDTDFFPDGPDSDLAGDYARAVDAARGVPDEPGYVTIYRGMSDAEYDAWQRGDEIPLGKFFAGIPSTQFAQDISGAPPQLYSFRVPRSMLMQTGEHEYQLKKRGRMKDGVIEPTQAVQASGLASHWQAVVDAVSAAAFVEAEHPRHPGGSTQGGEFAPKAGSFATRAAERQAARREEFNRAGVPPVVGFPPGIYTPNGAVKFLPSKVWIDNFSTDASGVPVSGPVWKALLTEDGSEKAFWFVDKSGEPHHPAMRDALGLSRASVPFVATGVGQTVKPEWTGTWGELLDAQDQHLMPRLRELLKRHRADIRDAEIMAKGPVAAAAVDYEGSGGMIALYPEPEEAEAIARANGQPPEDLHVTLLYFEDGVPEDAVSALGDLNFEPLKGQITGIARFQEGEDGVPVAGIVSAVGLNELRAELAERLPGFSTRHGFVPHLTLGYDQEEDPLVEDPEGAVGLPVTFRAVSVKNKQKERQDITAAGWSEAEHPRWPEGHPHGGEFRPKEEGDFVVSPARLGVQKGGGYRISKAPNLREWLRGGLEHGYNNPVLDDWPNLSVEQAAELRRWLQDPHLDRALAGRGLGKERQELGWVRRDLGEEPVAALPGEPVLPPGATQSVLDKVEIGGGRAADDILEAVRTVDQTVSYPQVPGEDKIAIKGVGGGSGRNAAIWRTHQLKPTKITVAVNGANRISSTTHELGHYLDSLTGQDSWAGSYTPDRARYESLTNEYRELTRARQRAIDRADRIDPQTGLTALELGAKVRENQAAMKLVDPQRGWSAYSSEQARGTLQPVVAAVKETEMYRKLDAAVNERAGGLYGHAFTYGGRTFSPGKSHIRYLMQPSEVIARSFEQYVASKNPESQLARTSRHIFSESAVGVPEYPGYMKGPDLENVNKVWDQVLEQRGLLKKKGLRVPSERLRAKEAGMTPAQRALHQRQRRVMGLA